MYSSMILLAACSLMARSWLVEMGDSQPWSHTVKMSQLQRDSVLVICLDYAVRSFDVDELIVYSTTLDLDARHLMPMSFLD